jgi:hypothetical protein
MKKIFAMVFVFIFVVSVSQACFAQGFHAGAGLGGGAAMIKAGYVFPPMRNISFALDAGYGFGNEYSVVAAGISGMIPLRNFYAGLNVAYADYSEAVTDIAGMGDVDKGSSAGVGLFVGKSLGKLGVQAGYNSAMGIVAEGVYKF